MNIEEVDSVIRIFPKEHSLHKLNVTLSSGVSRPHGLVWSSWAGIFKGRWNIILCIVLT